MAIPTTQILKEGKILLYPTDTVWGLGCDATNPDAVARIYQIKQRSESKSLIVLVSNLSMLQEYVTFIPVSALAYLQVPHHPTTIIYPQAQKLAPNAIAADGSVAIRIVQDNFCQQLINDFGKPIISTSANISGAPTPKYYKQISPEIIAQCDYIVPYKQEDTTIKKPSRLISFDVSGELIILRD